MLRGLNRLGRRVNASLEACLNDRSDCLRGENLVAADTTVPLLQLQEDHFLYSVVEHALDESLRDGEALDFKIAALLAAQAAIAAIFLGKGSAYDYAAIGFVALTIVSLLSLLLRAYGGAPNAPRFATDFVRDQKAARESAIVSKVEIINANERLLKSRSVAYTLLLVLTVIGLLCVLGLVAYNRIENGHRTVTEGALQRESPRPGGPHQEN